ncbi:tyrosine-type recombinase/integrase [Gaetbulibacter sp. M240]|uniref:tyrosine-type recombinase/integrase n=1 Tax=Gaetbulibacter sp. M240 TaxID=3126511 RepID=UPI00374EEC1E
MAIQSFIDYLLLEKNYATLTANAYRTDLEAFSEFLKIEDDEVGLESVQYSHVRQWIVSLVEEGLTNRSINRKISALNSYYKFLQKSGAIQINPLQKHRALKTKKKVQVPFSEKEVSQALGALHFKPDFEGTRNKLMIELFYTTGMRRIELINLELNSFDSDFKTLKVLGKRNKERIIPLLPSIKKSISDYLEQRSALDHLSDKDAFFLTKKGVKIYETLVYRIINDYFSKASSKVKKSPHILRHSFATHMLNQGADLNAVKELLGHSSLAATQVYTHNSIDKLKQVHVKAHPRSKK